VRWEHPERGLLAPLEFIPVAERSGLIEPLGTWVLKTACEEVAAWPYPVKVAVNLSAVQFSRGDLVATVAAILGTSGLSSDRLDLELTETILMDGDGLARAKLDEIRQTGVHVSLDDFGTGYSSLAYIKNFPIDKIKIDRSFIRDLETDLSSAAIVRAIVTLGQSLGLRVIAEGVETEAQLAILRGVGCDDVQGFLHGKPEPASEIIASLQEQRALVASTAHAGRQAEGTASAYSPRSIST
jgi:EAL domain-containing protein (putative c-di-GMP-specific phosphodiesterase class I)